MSNITPGLLLEGHYRVIASLNEGGFGETFEIEDENSGTLKVLKVLKLREFSDDDPDKQKLLALFRREAEVLQQLSHPGIPKGSGYFRFRPTGSLEPLHCQVMEKIEGEDLQSWMRCRENQPISQAQAIDWLQQLAKILETIHQNNYFHRDIKPSNIMLKPDGQLVLIDFGAVREITDTYWSNLERKNVTGINSQGYTPPEQHDGQAEPRSDFFALGRTFVYLLTGQSPIEFAKNDITGELMWRSSAREVSKSLADLLDYLMAIAPGRRPENGREILKCLKAVAKGRPARRKNQLTKSERLKSMAVKVGASGFILVGLTGLTVFELLRPQIAFMLNRSGRENYREQRWETAQSYFTWTVRLKPDYPEAHYNLGSVCENRGDIDCARQGYYQATLGDLDIGYNNLARLNILDEQYAEAVPLLLKGLQLVKKDKAKYNMHKNLGWAYLGLSRYTKAEEQLQAAMALDEERAPAHCLLAQVKESKGETQSALVAATNCIEKANEDNPDEKRWKEMFLLPLVTARGEER